MKNRDFLTTSALGSPISKQTYIVKTVLTILLSNNFNLKLVTY